MWPKTEHEERLEELFEQLAAGFIKVDHIKDPVKSQQIMKELSNKLKDTKTLVKEFEMEARTDGMPAEELAERKRLLVNELNDFIAMNKEYKGQLETREELLSGGRMHDPDSLEGKSTQELIRMGRRKLKEVDDTLNRGLKIVEDTTGIGKQAAITLHDQGDQLKQVVDDLHEIEFTMKKASKVIGDITRGLLTDRCIGFFLFLVVGGVIAIIVLKVVKPNADKVSVPTPNVTLPNFGLNDTISNIVGRRKTLETLHKVMQAGRLPR